MVKSLLGRSTTVYFKLKKKNYLIKYSMYQQKGTRTTFLEVKKRLELIFGIMHKYLINLCSNLKDTFILY